LGGLSFFIFRQPTTTGELYQSETLVDFEKPEYGFSLKYPENFVYRESDYDGQDYYKNLYGTAFFRENQYFPTEDRYVGFAQFTVLVNRIDDNLTAEEWVEELFDPILTISKDFVTVGDNTYYRVLEQGEIDHYTHFVKGDDDLLYGISTPRYSEISQYEYLLKNFSYQ